MQMTHVTAKYSKTKTETVNVYVTDNTSYTTFYFPKINFDGNENGSVSRELSSVSMSNRSGINVVMKNTKFLTSRSQF